VIFCADLPIWGLRPQLVEKVFSTSWGPPLRRGYPFASLTLREQRGLWGRLRKEVTPQVPILLGKQLDVVGLQE